MLHPREFKELDIPLYADAQEARTKGRSGAAAALGIRVNALTAFASGLDSKRKNQRLKAEELTIRSEKVNESKRKS
jgi:hypothetical protein